MRSRSAIVLLAVALLRGDASQAQAPLEVRVSMVGTLAQGQSATLTWTVIGTTEPVRLRLRNTSPTVGMLQGGDVQVAVTSGGTPNTVSRIVTGVSQGTFDVTVEIDDGRPPSRGWIAAAFRQELLNVAATLEKEAAAIPVRRVGLLRRRVILREDVVALLDRAEAEVRARLPYPELAAFRDGVAEVVGETRAQVMAMSTAGGMTSADDAARPLKEEEARGILGSITSFFRRLADTSPVTDVCVVSDPTAADVVLYPASFPSDRHSGQSTTRLTLYLGRYVYELRKSSVSYENTINFLTEYRRILRCNLRDTPGCNPVEGRPEDCR